MQAVAQEATVRERKSYTKEKNMGSRKKHIREGRLQHTSANCLTELQENFELLILLAARFETPNLAEELDP